MNKELCKKKKNKLQVNYANCHATSTLAGDLAEVNAIKKVFKDTSELKMNGTKVSHQTISSTFIAITQNNSRITIYLLT